MQQNTSSMLHKVQHRAHGKTLEFLAHSASTHLQDKLLGSTLPNHLLHLLHFH
jgi:hypothetical protein